MKKREFLSKIFVVAVLALIAVSANQAFAQQEPKPSDPAGDGTTPVAAAGFVSGLFSVLPGQSVRVSAVNMGKEAIPVEFVFVTVSEQGKVVASVLSNAATPAPGDAMIEKITITDGTSRKLMYVQIRVQDANDLKDIASSLEVFNEQLRRGRTDFFLGGGGFAEIRPIWVPS